MGQPLEVAVIGGGFSGLAAATMLARSGARVELIERNAAWSMDGAGISIGGPALRALHAIGVLDRFLEAGRGSDGVDVRTPAGEHFAQYATPRLVAPDLPGFGGIMRPVLGGILVDAMTDAGATARLGTTVHAVEDDGESVALAFSDGTRGRYDVVVGADGLYSETRQRLLPEAPAPRFSGQGAWRAVVPRPDEIQRTTTWVGGPSKVGVNPISQTEMYLFVNENAESRDRVPDDQLLDRLRALVEPFHDPVLRDARDTLGDGSLVLYRPMDNLLVPLPWHVDRVVLIGDAVHATTPHLAAGAGMGLEDAIVLAQELDGAADVEAALTSFENRRWERCRMVVENSARLGELEKLDGTADEHTTLLRESFAALAQPI